MDTIEFNKHQIVIKFPDDFIRTEKALTYGGKAFVFSTKPAISFFSIMESTNSYRDLGENCYQEIQYELNDRTTIKGVCLLKGYYRVDYFKGTRISVAYEVVSSCDLPFYDAIMDSVVLINVGDM